jgi:hypothetical protein
MEGTPMNTTLNKTVVWALVVVFFIIPGGLLAQAQERAGSAFSFGIKGGLSLPTLSSTVDERYPNKPVFGVFVAYNHSPNFATQLEILYLTQSLGWNCIFTDDQGNIIYEGPAEDLRMYIHIPFLAKFRIMNKSPVTPIVFAGPAMSVLLKTSTKPEIAAPDWTLEYRAVNLSFFCGGGLEAAVGRLVLSLDVRYDLGFADIHINIDEHKTNALMFMAGIGF